MGLGKKKREERRARQRAMKAGYVPTEMHPADGDVVLHCGHPDAERHHIYYAPRGVRFTRPDDSSGTASWIAACHGCFSLYGHDSSRYIRGDAIWQLQGEGPCIMVNPDIPPMTPAGTSDCKTN